MSSAADNNKITTTSTDIPVPNNKLSKIKVPVATNKLPLSPLQNVTVFVPTGIDVKALKGMKKTGTIPTQNNLIEQSKDLGQPNEERRKQILPDDKRLVEIATSRVAAMDELSYVIRDSYLMLLMNDKEGGNFIKGVNEIIKKGGALDMMTDLFSKMSLFSHTIELSKLTQHTIEMLVTQFKNIEYIFEPLVNLDGNNIKDKIGAVSEAFKSIIDLNTKLAESKLDFSKIVGNKFMGKIYMKILGNNIRYIIYHIYKIARIVTRIPDDLIKIISDKLKNIMKLLDQFKSLMWSILSIAAITPIAIAAMPIVVVGLHALDRLLIVMNKVSVNVMGNKIVDDMKNIALCVLGISVMVLGFYAASAHAGQLLLAIPKMMLLMAAMVPLLWSVKLLLNMVHRMSAYGSSNTVKQVFALNMIFVGLSTLCIAIWGFSLLSPILFNSLPTVLLMMVGLLTVFLTIWGFFKLTYQMTDWKGLARFVALGAIFVILGGLVIGLIYFSAIGVLMLSVYDIILLTLAGLAIIVGAVALIGYVIGKSFQNFAVVGKGLLVLMGILSLLTLLVYEMNYIAESSVEINKHFTDTLLLLGNITATTTAVVGIALLATTAMPVLIPALIGLGLVTLSIGAICLIAKGLEYLQKFELDKKKLEKNVSTIKNTIFSINNMLFAESDVKRDGNSGFFQSIVDAVIPTFSNIFRAISTVGYLASSLASIWMFKLLAKQLKELQDIQIDENKLTYNIKSILDVAQMCIDVINRPSELENKSKKKGLSKLLSWVSNKFSSVADYMSMMGKLSTYMISVGMIHTLAQYMKTINDIKLDNVVKKVDSIISVASSITKNVLDEDNLKIKNFRDANKRVDLLERVGEVVAEFADVSSGDVKRSETLINNYVKFIDKINTADLTNLKTTVELFQRMTEFSKSIAGDFDKLADALQEKIAPLLERLEEHVSKMKMDVSTGIDLSRMNNHALTATAAASGVRINSNTTEREIEDQKEVAYDNSLQNSEIPELLQEIIEILNQRR